jgi:hypothetical protein
LFGKKQTIKETNVGASEWLDKASISLLTLYVAYDAYSEGRTAIALIATAFFIAGIVIEVTARKTPG